LLVRVRVPPSAPAPALPAAAQPEHSCPHCAAKLSPFRAQSSDSIEPASASKSVAFYCKYLCLKFNYRRSSRRPAWPLLATPWRTDRFCDRNGYDPPSNL